MRSVFEKFRQPDLMQEVMRLKNNPSEVADVMMRSGKISQEQYNHIKQMNNPKDICIYLMGQNEQFRNAVQMMRTLQG